MTASLGDTMPLKKCTSKFQPPTTGPKCYKKLRNTRPFAYGANKERTQPTRRHLWHLYRFPTDQISKFTLTYSAP
jgi:hypothetical protein